eukprot:CAMPEP_0195062820 /NCGR_PEP_ID=MMETSP0448-20130528/9342_1 /TAXON_ID=66468 /ORGANISM="Heterocapsa triquestra, Strain CCMP 448" /LENGTH=102 /DNA_ID=CAMNT_0040093575 /DNA_START=151 /DNA_END=460 /DNA_ORIENTATION=-
MSKAPHITGSIPDAVLAAEASELHGGRSLLTAKPHVPCQTHAGVEPLMGQARTAKDPSNGGLSRANTKQTPMFLFRRVMEYELRGPGDYAKDPIEAITSCVA